MNSDSFYVYQCMYVRTYVCRYVCMYVRSTYEAVVAVPSACVQFQCVMCFGTVGPKPLVTLPLSTLYWTEKVYIVRPQATLDIGKNESIQPFAAAVDKNSVMPCQCSNKQDHLIAVIQHHASIRTYVHTTTAASTYLSSLFNKPVLYGILQPCQCGT